MNPADSSTVEPNLWLYLQLISEYDFTEYLLAGGREPIPASRVLVRFDDERALHESAYYWPDDGDLPRVFIHRPGFAAVGDYRAMEVARGASDPLRELLWFSHELGHHQVVLNGLGTGVRDDQRPGESYAEEVLAWLYAERILRAHGFNDWDTFHQTANTSLQTYEAGFNLDSCVAAELRRSAEAQLNDAG